MHQTEDEKQTTNVTKTTLSNLHATLAAKEHPEPYIGHTSATTLDLLPGQSYSAQELLTQDLDFLNPVSKNLQPGTNHKMTTHRETKTNRSPEETTEVSEVSALRKGRRLTQERLQTN